MEACDICGEEIEHPFRCNYCGDSFCGEHRLPEYHDCEQFNPDDSLGILNSSSPNITDRRGTWGKMVSRVREKETEKWVRKVDEDFDGGNKPDLSTDSDSKILNCPVCEGNAASLKEASCCGETMCPDCLDSHDCDNYEKEDTESTETTGLFHRLMSWF